MTPILSAQNLNDSLMEAVIKNDTLAMNDLIGKGASVNFVKEEGWMKVNALITAVNKEHVDAVRILLESGVDVNWIDGFNTTALMYAASNGNLKIVNLLLDFGADVEHQDQEGNDAISAGKENGHFEISNLLQEKMEN